MQTYRFKSDRPVDLTSVIIEGDRINLLSIDESYAEEIFKEFNEGIIRYMMPSIPDKVEGTQAFISESLGGMRSGYDLVTVITKKDSSEFLGCCGFHGRGKPHTPEFGIWLKKSAHGNAYGLEAIKTLGHWAVEHIDFDYAIYPVDRANVASRKIPETLGGIIIEEKQVPTLRGTTLDELVFKITPKNLLVDKQ